MAFYPNDTRSPGSVFLTFHLTATVASSLRLGMNLNPEVMERNDRLGLFPGCTLGPVVVAVAMTLKKRPREARTGEEEE